MECPECGCPDPDIDIFYDGDDAQSAYTIVCNGCGNELYVPAEATSRSRIDAIRSIVREHSAKRIEGYVVDAFTAQMLLTVYNALSQENKEKFGKVSLPKLVDLGWRCVK